MSVVGLPELLTRFAKAEVVAHEAEQTGVDELGHQVEQRAQDLAPVDTGTLRDSISYADGKVATDVEYAAFVEYGTSDTPAQPFMRPAADESEGGPLDAAEAVLRKI